MLVVCLMYGTRPGKFAGQNSILISMKRLFMAFGLLCRIRRFGKSSSIGKGINESKDCAMIGLYCFLKEAGVNFNADKTKIHLACWDGTVNPLNEYYAGSFQEWQ